MLVSSEKLRQLIAKGSSHREQNHVNWNLNAKICKEVVSYRARWLKKKGVDRRVLNEWYTTALIGESSCLGLNKLRSMSYKIRNISNICMIFSTNMSLFLQAANNTIAISKKYNSDVVLNELSATNTYVHDNKECEQVIFEHTWYMTNNRIEAIDNSQQGLSYIS